MKLKLMEPGMDSYTGMHGQVEFENGVSTDHVSKMDASRLGAVMRVCWLDDEDNETPAGTGQDLVDRAVSGIAPETSDETSDETSEETSEETSDETATGEGEAVGYDADTLAAIADEQGIDGLRSIAEPLGIRGRSIRDLIEQIIQHTAD